MKRFPIKIAGLFIGIGLIFFAFMNLISASLYRWLSGSRGIDLHALETYGFPFVMHKYGGNPTIDQFVWSGVVANLSVAFGSSLIIGLIVGYLWQRLHKWRYRYQ